ncbi:hypothetical protein MCGE09_00653, partial [Thaumarchaeota archaeon SCGC AB-539-E09]
KYTIMSEHSHTYEEDLEFFRVTSEELASEHRGKFLLVKNGENLGIFSSFEDAHRTALEMFGTEDVVIGQIGIDPPLNFIAAVV